MNKQPNILNPNQPHHAGLTYAQNGPRAIAEAEAYLKSGYRNTTSYEQWLKAGRPVRPGSPNA